MSVTAVLSAHEVPVLVCPPGCAGPGVCSGSLYTLRVSCEHEHIGEEQICERHLEWLLAWPHDGCSRCRHPVVPCVVVLFVKETAQMFVHGELGTWC